jgi:ribosomal protein L37AE/L43A
MTSPFKCPYCGNRKNLREFQAKLYKDLRLWVCPKCSKRFDNIKRECPALDGKGKV